MNKEKYILVPSTDSSDNYFEIIYNVDIRTAYMNAVNSMRIFKSQAITQLMENMTRWQGKIYSRSFSFDELKEMFPDYINDDIKYKFGKTICLGGEVRSPFILSHNNDCFILGVSKVFAGRVSDHAIVMNSDCDGHNIIEDNSIIIRSYVNNSGTVHLCDNTYIVCSFFNLLNECNYLKISGYTTISQVKFEISAKAKVHLHNCTIVEDSSTTKFYINFYFCKNQNLNGFYFNFTDETKDKYLSFFKKYPSPYTQYANTKNTIVITDHKSNCSYTVLIDDFIKNF